MKPLQNRVKKLETKSPKTDELPLVFFTFVDVDGSKDVGLASVPGTEFGYIKRGESETEGTFYRRIYAIKITNEFIEPMTDQDLNSVIADSSDKLAKEYAETGAISGKSLERAVGYTEGHR